MYTLQTCIKVAKCNVIFSLLLFILQNIVTIMNGGICDARVHVELVPVGGVGPITVWPHQHVLGLPLQLGRGVPQLLEGVIVVSLVDRDGVVEHLVLHRDLVLGVKVGGWVAPEGHGVWLGELLHLVCPGAARLEAGVELVDGDGPHLHLRVGDVRGGAALVPRHKGDDGGPGAAQVPGPEHDAAVLRLQPVRQPPARLARAALCTKSFRSNLSCDLQLKEM